MLTEIETTTVIGGVKLVNNPELIKVKTLNKRIAEQLQFLDGEAGMFDVKPVDFKSLGIIGTLAPYRTLIVQDRDGHIYKVRSMAYLQYLMDHSYSHEDANRTLNALPQIFES